MIKGTAGLIAISLILANNAQAQSTNYGCTLWEYHDAIDTWNYCFIKLDTWLDNYGITEVRLDSAFDIEEHFHGSLDWDPPAYTQPYFNYYQQIDQRIDLLRWHVPSDPLLPHQFQLRAEALFLGKVPDENPPLYYHWLEAPTNGLVFGTYCGRYNGQGLCPDYF